MLLLSGGIALTLLASLGIFYWLMHPPMSDVGHMSQFLALTAAVSIAAGFGAYRMGWLDRAPSLHWALAGTYVLASLLTFLNVWLTARLMFASRHDLLLATVLLFFAGGIAAGRRWNPAQPGTRVDLRPDFRHTGEFLRIGQAIWCKHYRFRCRRR